MATLRRLAPDEPSAGASAAGASLAAVVGEMEGEVVGETGAGGESAVGDSEGVSLVVGAEEEPVGDDEGGVEEEASLGGGAV